MTNHSTQQTGASGGSGVALPVGLQLGRYRLLRKIGQGGFGITYLAEHIQSHEQVVIKENLPTFYAYRDKDSLHVYPLDDGSSAENYSHTLQRFVEEARTLARLNHPNIVRVLEAFEALGTAYYVMPYIEAKELHRVIPTEAVDEAWLQPILKAVLGALDYLHAKNLLHRDLKPGNILLREDGTPILIDFGTARALQTERSATMVGTPGYTPLEQITPNGNRGPWTDLYALGATCYRLITGEPPPQSIERIDDDPYHPLVNCPELQGRFSPAFLHAIDTALAVRAKKRWQSARTWLDDLNPGVSKHASRPLPVAPHHTTGNDSALLTKHRPLIFGLLVLLLAVGAYGVYSCNQSDGYDKFSTLLKAKEEADRRAREIEEQEAMGDPIKYAQYKLKCMGITYYDEAICKYYKNPEKLQLLITAGANVNTSASTLSASTFPGSTPLCQAARFGLTEVVKLLLAAPGIDINMADKDGETPLYCAAERGHAECVKLLLAAPDIDTSDWPSITIAVLKNDGNTLKQLIQSGNNVNKADKDGRPLLYWAARYGHAECVKLLLAAPGIDVNKADKDGRTPLYWAAECGHADCVKLLLEHPRIDVNHATNEYRETPLHLATIRGHTEVVKRLLEHPRIDVNKADKDGYTPLYNTIVHGHPDCVKLLLEHPRIDTHNLSPILIAAWKNDSDTLNQLIRSGIDVNKADKNGYTPLYWAARYGHAECVKLLLSTPGIDINEADKYGSTPLYWAARNGHAECVKLLLAAPGIEVNKADKDGYTPLGWAAYWGHTECVKLLLAAPGIKVNKADKYGQTPLYKTMVHGHPDCVKLLLEHPRIDVNKATKDGETPLHEAARYGHAECVKLLLSTPGININKVTKQGSTPLYGAASYGHAECVKLLLSTPGIDINEATKDGETPLYKAAWAGHADCVKLLLAAPGIYVNKANKDGKTPLQIATEKGKTESAKLLRAAGGK